MNDMSNTPALLGHNNPPQDLTAELADRYKLQLDQVADLKEVAQTVPDEITSDEMQAKAAELNKKLRFLEKTLDGARDIEKEPHAKKVATVNGFFKARMDDLKALREKINERSSAYLEKKAAAERRRVQEEEERRRQKAAEDLRLAQEAEAKRREAEAQQRRAEEEARAAQAARERAQAEARAAEERAARAKLEEARLKAEAQARAKADEEERARQQQLMAEARAAREAEEEKARLAREEAAQALAERRKAEEEAARAKAEAKTASRDENEAMASAVREEKRADRLAAVAEGPEADLARTRSEYGAVSTLSRKWEARVIDRNLLNKEALWNLIDGEAIAVALRKWMLLQPQDMRTMPGAVFEEVTVAQVR